MSRFTSASAPLCKTKRIRSCLAAGFFCTPGAIALTATSGYAQDPPGEPQPLPAVVWSFLADPSKALWIRPLSSAAIPGSGQLLGGRDRGAVYLIAEAFFIARFVAEQREGTREEQRYKDLAFQVARKPFNPTIRDTAFTYFEEMARFIESGPFDTDPGPALVPPLDERTFNGWLWKLARETFFANPDSIPSPESIEYQRALEFYRRRAVGPNFRWSWRGAALEHDLFRVTIRASDQAFRSATQYLGLILVNHLVSMVDAFVTERLGLNREILELSPGAWAAYGGEPQFGVRGRVRF
ncbi:MAG: hypothetical protein KatS3mg081_0414 [Gemmatimonadales bacterium]|nr:hypothetical protein HRbin33_02383 [bacterium HR33]GIW51059.1 MAG: hypothetical protein KatS3mg081_0414 [Gemmatimonadales bacterium]